MNKAVIIINGAGGVGKDTLCDAAATSYKTRNISTITPIKEIAAQCGWNGAKDNKSRKFLSDMKKGYSLFYYTFAFFSIISRNSFYDEKCPHLPYDKRGHQKSILSLLFIQKVCNELSGAGTPQTVLRPNGKS